jgi:hypothetical protein
VSACPVSAASFKLQGFSQRRFCNVAISRHDKSSTWFDERDDLMINLNVEPLFDGLRSKSAF